MRLIIFDICDTLFRENTTFGFLAFYFKKRPFKNIIFLLLSSKYSPLFYVLIFSSKLLQKDVVRILSIYLLKGEGVELLRSEVNVYADYLIENRANLQVMSILKEKYNQNEEVILISSSIDLVVEAIASKLGGLPFFSTKLRYFNGRSCGIIEYDLTGKKQEVVPWGEYSYTEVISDNKSDAPLMQRADKSLAIVYNLKQQCFWDKLSIDTLHVQ
jgi:phosphoserine phosphatase